MTDSRPDDAQAAFERLHEAGLTGSDAAKVIGDGHTEAIGGALARGTSDRVDGSGPAGQMAPPPDVSVHWEDVNSRYEMLFGQRYGATEWTWPTFEPLYRLAWDAANAPRWRGRPWSEARGALRQQLDGRLGGVSWDDIEGGLGDVWEDVADEVHPGRQGGDESQVWEPDAGTGQEGRAPR